MKFLAVTNNISDPGPHIPDEARRTEELRAAGVLEQLYLKADRSGAVLILDAQDAEEAERQLGTLPLVERGVVSVELTELVVPD
jgi:muconolactone delta-isomerase